MIEPPIRQATTSDAPGIARVHTITWQVAYKRLISEDYLNSLSVEARTERWAASLRAQNSLERTFVAEAGGDIVGFASVGVSRDRDAEPDSGELQDLYVDPTYWNSGIGSRLEHHALDWLAQRGIDTAMLWVLEANAPARKFYERRKWVADGSVKAKSRGSVKWKEVRYTKAILKR